MALKSLEFTVKGTVQGVNFRSWTVKTATSLGVTGHVKNVDSGDVVGVAEGDQAALSRFTKALEKGPSAADVHDVQVSNEKDIDKQQYSSFDQ